MSQIRVGIVENDDSFRDELILRLKKAPYKPSIEYWQSAESFLKAGASPDILLLDIMLPGITGIELAQKLTEIGHTSKIIMLTNMNSDAMIFEAIQNGAMGYVLKSELDELEKIVETVSDGGAILTPTIALRVIQAMRQRQRKEPDFGLTPRQHEILNLMVGGKTTVAVAKHLQLSPHTVHGYVKEIYKKLNVHSRAELVGKVLQHS